jgi:glycosyltransferase involved in cell wall biosynthesis
MSSQSPLFTVLTPAFNRAATLGTLYRSLCSQTFRDFEWLIVDDGSNDDTAAFVCEWAASSEFLIRYMFQENAGKHVAFNRGVREARGILIAEIDSDDELKPQALERLISAWLQIPESERADFVGVTGLCVDESNLTIGGRFPEDRFVSDTLETQCKYRIKGEKWGFQRRDVLLEFPFPEPVGIKFIPESVVWGRIARKYRTLYINEPLRVYHRDGSETKLTRKAFSDVARGVLLAHELKLTEDIDWLFVAPHELLRSAVHYARAGFHVRRSLRSQVRRLSAIAVLLWAVALPLGYYLYSTDQRV